MSGCGGLVDLDGPKTIMRRYAEAATRAGAYAAIVDSFGARGIGFTSAVGTVCSGVRLRGRERAGDILAAERLAREAWGDAVTSVVHAGWSHGGWAIMELLAAGPEAGRVGPVRIHGEFASLSPEAVVLFYPYCGALNSSRRKTWAFGGPVLLVSAELDSIGAKEACEAILEHARGGMDGTISVHFRGATHAFDEEGEAIRPDFEYDPVLAARAQSVFYEFIAGLDASAAGFGERIESDARR